MGKGQQEEALAQLEGAINMQKNVYGERYLSHPTVAKTQRILGDFYFHRAEYEKAHTAYQLAIDMNRTIYQTDELPFQQELFHLKNNALKAFEKPFDQN